MGLVLDTLKCKWHKAMMTHAQRKLYDDMAKNVVCWRSWGEKIYTVPPNTNNKDLAEVEYELGLETKLKPLDGWDLRYRGPGLNPGL